MDGFMTSEATDKLDAALAKAQAEISTASKDKTNPHFKSKYADLASVWEACRDALTRHGVSVTQWPVHSDDGRLHMITRLAHGGQWLRGHFSIPAGKNDAQGYGSAITYAKRFALSAAVGVVADDDDDGNAASRGNGSPEHRTPPPPPPPSVRPVNGNGHKPHPAAISDDARREAAETFVQQAIDGFTAMRSREDVQGWWKANSRHIDKLEANYPDLHNRLTVAFDSAVDAKPSLRMAG